MGSIPVGGANARLAARRAFCVGTPDIQASVALRAKAAQGWVRIFGAERVKLACKRQAERSSPAAKYSFGVPMQKAHRAVGFLHSPYNGTMPPYS
jgi:hypothetical protein